jgi:hypothetical protein
MENGKFRKGFFIVQYTEPEEAIGASTDLIRGCTDFKKSCLYVKKGAKKCCPANLGSI